MVPHGERHAAHQPGVGEAAAVCSDAYTRVPKVDDGPQSTASGDCSTGIVERGRGESDRGESQVTAVFVCLDSGCSGWLSSWGDGSAVVFFFFFNV